MIEVGADRLRSSKAGTGLSQKYPASNERRPNKIIPEAVAWLVWPTIVALPLYCTTDNAYLSAFPEPWRLEFEAGATPSPVGLVLGILAVAVGQCCTLM